VPSTFTVPSEDSVLGRSATLLGAFRPGDDVLSLAEIHRRTGMPKPTAHRLLNQLAGWRFLDRAADGYRLGLRLFELGQLVPGQHHLRATVAPVLARLHDTTGHTVHLAILDGTDVVYVQKIDAADAPQVASRIGGRIPAHCTAVGKALLAHSPDTVRVVLDQGLRRRSPRTVAVPALLLRQLDQVRRLGFAREDEETAVGISCVAAPVFDGEGHVAAALSITARASSVRSLSTIAAVRQAAADATRRLAARRSA
jgi:IclR family transcriptional regulator, acetate operon repressor